MKVLQPVYDPEEVGVCVAAIALESRVPIGRLRAGPGAHLTQPAERVVPRGPHRGRNDPCPCGSGKKYKRCCLGQ